MSWSAFFALHVALPGPAVESFPAETPKTGKNNSQYPTSHAIDLSCVTLADSIYIRL